MESQHCLTNMRKRGSAPPAVTDQLVYSTCIDAYGKYGFVPCYGKFKISKENQNTLPLKGLEVHSFYCHVHFAMFKLYELWIMVKIV